MNTQNELPPTGIKDNCVIILVRIPDPQRPGKTKRTSISMHQEHFRRISKLLGGYAWVIRIVKYIASKTHRGPGDNFSQLVWSELEATKEQWRKAIESGRLK